MPQSLAPRQSANPRRSSPAGGERSHLEIDLGRLEHNLQHLQKRIAPDSVGAGAESPGVCAVLKKQGYGLGAVTLAHRLVRAGAAMLAVYDAPEAEELVTAGITAPILVMMPLRELDRTNALYRHAARERLHLTVHEPDQLADLHELGHRFGLRLPVHFYLDTGMSRGGLSGAQLGEAVAQAEASRFIRIAGVYSHLAAAEADGEFTETQRKRFDQAVADQAPSLDGGAVRHLANTCGTLRDPALHYQMIRPGLGLLGYGPEQMPPELGGDGEGLAPVLRWLSRVSHLQQYPAGATIGYNVTDQLTRDSLLAVVPVGYGDGYPLALSNQASVRVQLPAGGWHEAPVRGRVSMDQLVIDLTDAPAWASDLRNTTVEVYGNEPDAPNALPKLAQQAGTHCYEMLCRLSPRLKRCYVNG